MQPHDMSDLNPDQIAAALERERADLARTIDGLRDRLSVNALIGDALGYAKANMAPCARALDGAVRANPMAAVMAGVGLAWLVLGRNTTPAAEPLAPLPDRDHAWIVEADALRDRASDRLARIDAAARARLRPAAEVAGDRAAVLADLAKATRAAMLRGLDHLTSDARDRIVAAREQAYAARMVAVRQGTKLIEGRPVVAGAIGFAIGAAVAAAVPRTRTEDRLFGQERDRLLARARGAAAGTGAGSPDSGAVGRQSCDGSQ
jgi:hypothetical protein